MVKVVEYKDLKPTELQASYIGYKWKSSCGGNLEVIDYSHTEDFKMYYKVWCSKCSVDTEMTPEQYFRQDIYSIKKGMSACFCVKNKTMNERQYLLKLNRSLEEIGHSCRAVAIEDPTNSVKYVICECSVCSKDKELWPYGSIVSIKHTLLKGAIPCGCNENIKSYTEDQCKILLRRELQDSPYEILGWKDGIFKGRIGTKVKLIDHRTGVINDNTTIERVLKGCREKRTFINSSEAFNLIRKRMKETGSKFYFYREKVGEPERGYKGLRTKIISLCKNGHWRNTTIKGFLDQGCAECHKTGWGVSNQGYYMNRLQEEDHLYIMLFDNEYIKIGRSFNPKERVGQLRKESGTKNITTLHLFKGSHYDIRTLEKNVHRFLYNSHLHHKESTWSKETFQLKSYQLAIDFINMDERVVDLECEIG